MKLIDFIICDDIRNELGNKQSLIGVYGENIIFNVPPPEKGKWPKVLKLAFFIRIKLEQDDDRTKLNKFRLNVIFNEKIKTLAEGIINVDLNSKGILLAVVFNQFVFENSGLMSASVELMDNAGLAIHYFEIPDKINILEIN
jgi:hypothetical protein